mgnify:CR=1 FL=1
MTKLDPADLTDNTEPSERMPGVPETYKYPWDFKVATVPSVDQSKVAKKNPHVDTTIDSIKTEDLPIKQKPHHSPTWKTPSR